MSPICLPDSSDEPEIYENAKAIAVGWGTTNSSTGEMPDALHHVGLKTLSNDNCGDYGDVTGIPDIITENMICAGQEDKDSCWGDSGGRLYPLKFRFSNHQC